MTDYNKGMIHGAAIFLFAALVAGFVVWAL
jgi:hypothetical protein